jgi:acetyltransferase
MSGNRESLAGQVSSTTPSDEGDWTRHTTLPDGRKVVLRPLREEDGSLYPAFAEHVTDEDVRRRFFAVRRELSPATIARFTRFDRRRAMAFAAIDLRSGELLGISRLHSGSPAGTGEFAVLVRSDFKGLGLGWRLMELLLDWARAKGPRIVVGLVLRDNTTMVAMCRALGFQVRAEPGDPTLVQVRLVLDGCDG